MNKTKFLVSLIISAVLITVSTAISAAADMVRFNADNEAPGILKGNRAIHLYGSTLYNGLQKQPLKASVIKKDDNILITEPDFEIFFEENVSRLGSKISISGGISMTLNACSMKYGGKEYTLSAAPELVDGILYLPINEYMEFAYSSEIYDDGHGLLITTSGSYDELKNANLFMFFDRKTPVQLKAEFLSSSNNGTKHPRIIADADDFKRIADEIKNDKVKKEWYSQVIYTANSILNQGVSEYKINNGRLLDTANGALSRLEYLGFAYQVTGDARYSERGIKELQAICAFPDWHPEHFLDTATLASAAAIGYDWLYSAMTAKQRTDIAAKSQQLALDCARAAYENRAAFNSFWINTETNWGVVCNGGISILALATGEYDTDNAMELLSYALRGIEYPWYRFAPDGSWYEGTGYWSYLLTHLWSGII